MLYVSNVNLLSLHKPKLGPSSNTIALTGGDGAGSTADVSTIAVSPISTSPAMVACVSIRQHSNLNLQPRSSGDGVYDLVREICWSRKTYESGIPMSSILAHIYKTTTNICLLFTSIQSSPPEACMKWDAFILQFEGRALSCPCGICPSP